ncbi:hypothetical protein FAZ19_21955 [Sphingobacterium alkalisoli]|uniref:Toxin-antitoxin system YwqK family antitoxin n=1 Tax=Sphingobacterium alkalisoli TaxID=1874115 RepID=A0A4U0GRB7_9SPHI|nr:hypothetical protein [Sphingobacterium alkalisoli]TJY61286.1 hypothetical protein FAZ19_21955 [Sphingobacterium alkalisoli]GGH31197.1 hypothetical protein GCM10011418_43810 [Sphingobacterium alkalisoli]
MKKSVLLLIYALFYGNLCWAQQDSVSKPIFFEQAPQGLVRFFFDQNYYLVDKNCPYKYIERVVGFIPSKNQFHGEFKDFGPNGHILLSGNYINGKKDGIFKAYHPNGKLKWETTFKDGEYFGEWNYYYPDGKPMLFLEFDTADYAIKQMWNQKGKQIVTDGEGKYDFTMPIIGFTEHGFTFYNRKGKIKNGKPEGIWQVMLGDHQKTNYYIGEEYYENGIRHRVHHVYDFFNYYRASLTNLKEFSILPNDYFGLAELLLSKNCSFDDFSGFSIYLAKRFTTSKNLLNRQIEGDFQATIQYKVAVSLEEEPKVIEINFPDSLPPDTKEALETIIRDVPYYLHSYKDGQEIDDMLTVTFNITNSPDELIFHSVRIQREKGE